MSTCFVEFLFCCVICCVCSAHCNSFTNFHSKYDFSHEKLGQGLIHGGNETKKIETPW